MLSSKEIRSQFIDFFKSKQHIEVKSSPVIPNDDPTLLFTNAGMNQFKNIFLGISQPQYSRAVNSQKCIRAGGKHNDLEEVGKDGYHHTFFEMLGNWSFADYYKQEAISWAWELLTDKWQFEKDKLFATVHHSDQEAFELWQKLTDIDPAHITYHGDKDNFWEMGESGPCGPCSEIHYDRGAEYCDKKGVANHLCTVNGDCARYIEIWNLVFIQYNRNANRELQLLANKYVDTGAGLERICQIMQSKSSNYDTDLFYPIIMKIEKLSGVKYSDLEGVSHRVIADHIRALCFALGDGGFPSNEGRGYVIRRILRRAARHGRLLGFKNPFLYMLVDVVIDIMGHHYVELREKENYIKMVIKAEEERFNQTLDTGLERFNEIVNNLKGTEIPGKDVFLLSDTYGFPPDLTKILAEEKNLTIDEVGFNAELDKQRSRARESSNFRIKFSDLQWINYSKGQSTEFIGYEKYHTEAKIIRYAFSDDGFINVQLDKTPFYAESGGQIADKGKIYSSDFEIEVVNVKKTEQEIIHIGKMKYGVISDASVKAEIEIENRLHTSRNHTATHLLHKALKMVLGDHVEQKGSLVCPEYFRFDFSHFEALSLEQIIQIESIINEQIRNNKSVTVQNLPIEIARKEGAVALFGEKYGDVVRVVSIEGFSKELCGGTHVQATGEIGIMKIVAESSSAAGIRRIEGLTGKGVEDYFHAIQNRIYNIARKINSSDKQIEAKLDSIMQELSDKDKELKNLKQQGFALQVDDLLHKSVPIKDYNLLVAKIEAESVEYLRMLGDMIKSKAESLITILFTVIDDKVTLLTIVSDDLINRYHAGKIVGKIAEMIDGKGGGKPDMAMAGGKAVDKIDMAMKKTTDLIASL